jgi:hypothetical protein
MILFQKTWMLNMSHIMMNLDKRPVNIVKATKIMPTIKLPDPS